MEALTALQHLVVSSDTSNHNLQEIGELLLGSHSCHKPYKKALLNFQSLLKVLTVRCKCMTLEIST